MMFRTLICLFLSLESSVGFAQTIYLKPDQALKVIFHDSKEITFRENMVIVIQPNLITYDEKMGLQFGETLVVKKNGCESLNSFPRRWVTCDR